MIVVWDEPKRQANIAKHGIDFADIGEEFFASALIGDANDGRYFARRVERLHRGDLCQAWQRGYFHRFSPTSQSQGKEAAVMTQAKYTQADMDVVSDNPELTVEDIAKAKPFAEAFPDLAATIRRRGAQKAPTKVSTTVRLDQDVLTRLKADGPGWQTRMNDTLRKALGV